MTAMPITCPTAGGSVNVATTGTGSGTLRTICVQGTLAASIIGPAQDLVADASGVSVMVFPGNVGAPVGIPAGATPAVIAGSDWCARNVPVADILGEATAVAWQFVTATGSIEFIDVQHFFVVEMGGVDCCDGCVDGTSVASKGPTAELAYNPDLLVSVPDGKNQGTFKATAASPLKWQLSIGGATFQIACDAAGTGLLISGSKSSARSTSIAWGPFSASVPGAIFGASYDVVVIQS